MKEENEQNTTPSEERRDAVRERFSPLLDGELPADERDALERELAGDAQLLRELEALKRVDALYRDLPRCGAPADMAERVRRLVEPEPLRFRRRLVQRALWPVLAAAAMFVVFAVVLTQSRWAGQGRPMFVAKSEALADRELQRAQPEAVPVPSRTTAGSAPADNVSGLPADDAENLVSQFGGFSTASGGGAGAGRESNAAFAPELDAVPAMQDRPHEEVNGAHLFREETAGYGLKVEAGEEQGAGAAEWLGEQMDEPDAGDSSGIDFAARRRAGGVTVPQEMETEVDKQEGAPLPTSDEIPGGDYWDAGAEAREKEKFKAPKDPAERQVQAYGVVSEPLPVPSPPPAAPVAKTPEAAVGKRAIAATGIRSEDSDADAKSGQTRTIGECVFYLREGVWCEEGYEGQDTTALQRGSEALDALLAGREDLVGLLKLPGWIVFQLDGVWYQVVPPQAAGSAGD